MFEIRDFLPLSRGRFSFLSLLYDLICNINHTALQLSKFIVNSSSFLRLARKADFRPNHQRQRDRHARRGSATPAGRAARRPSRPEPQTLVPRRGGRRAGWRTQGARSEDASERDGACGVARAQRPNDAATGERRPRRRSAASGPPPADAPPAPTGPGRTSGLVEIPPSVPGARQGCLAPPAQRWRSRRALSFGIQHWLPAWGEGRPGRDARGQGRADELARRGPARPRRSRRSPARRVPPAEPWSAISARPAAFRSRGHPGGGVAAAASGSDAKAGDRARVAAVPLGDAPAPGATAHRNRFGSHHPLPRGRAAPGRSPGPPPAASRPPDPGRPFAPRA